MEAALEHYLVAPDSVPAFVPDARQATRSRGSSTTSPASTDRFCIREFERRPRPARPPDLDKKGPRYGGGSIERVRRNCPHGRGRPPTPSCASGACVWLGLCPFHHERSTPSFSVDPAEKLYYCFGCQAGDIFHLPGGEGVGARLRDAVEQLADRHGVELETTPAGATTSAAASASAYWAALQDRDPSGRP